MKEHTYSLELRWTGDLGSGTSEYTAYARNHELNSAGKGTILGSSDPAFRGDPSRWNPEELLVAALSACHMLWFLHLASKSGVNVIDYRDEPHGAMVEDDDGGGRFSEVVLRPQVTVEDEAMIERARPLHTQAHSKCFIANSTNFAVRHDPSFLVGVKGAPPNRM